MKLLWKYYEIFLHFCLTEHSLVQDAHRDFRIAANDMQDIVKKMNANGACELTREVLDAIRRAR